MPSTKKYNCFLLDVLPLSEVMLYFHAFPSKEWVSLVLVLPGVLFVIHDTFYEMSKVMFILIEHVIH